MNIKPRIGNTVLLTKEAILEKIDDYSILCHYIGREIPIRRAFRSPLHDDKKPSFWVFQLKGKLIFKDFTLGYTGDCFKYVMVAYSEDFYSALRRINQDFNLGLVEGVTNLSSNTKIIPKPVIPDFEYSVITYKPRPWNQFDRDYWSQYSIQYQTLVQHCVVPIAYFWINGVVHKADQIAYAYNVAGDTKIYQPYNDFLKWVSNQKPSSVFGVNHYDPYADVLIFTKSNKDLMCFNECKYSSLASAAENSLPNRAFFEGLIKRHRKVILFWDNDYDKRQNWGQLNAKKILAMYPELINVFIPTEYQSKDFSDLIKNKGFDFAKGWLQTTLDAALESKEKSSSVVNSIKLQGL